MEAIKRLLVIMDTLRDPETGCSWDRQQNYTSLVPYTLEEAYEVADAIQRQDFAELRDELGDLLFQIVFCARIASEEKRFDFADVCHAVSDKMERRHPHIFAGEPAQSSHERALSWEQGKMAERRQKA